MCSLTAQLWRGHTEWGSHLGNHSGLDWQKAAVVVTEWFWHVHLFPSSFKLAFARILYDFSLSSEVLKLLLKLLLKKAFSELTMEKSIFLSLSYILMCWAPKPEAKSQRSLSSAKYPQSCCWGNGSGNGVPVRVPPPLDRRGQLLIKEKHKKKEVAELSKWR